MPSFILFATPFSCLDKGSSIYNPTSNQFNRGKHYTMKKACRITTDHPFSIRHNGKKHKFFRTFCARTKWMIPNRNYFGQQFQTIFLRNNFYKIAKQFEKKKYES